MKYTFILPILVCSFLFPCTLLAQPSNTVLDQYISEALATNHDLTAKQFALEKNILALDEARRLFLPEIGFGITYTLASGGRNIQIPVGDLMNPVYTTLNQLTQSSLFPQIGNVEEQFLPDNFYDARFRIRQPIVNRSIYYNRRIRQESVTMNLLDIELYKRELVHDVKVAYYHYQQASESVLIYDNALELLEENQRVNESLLRNDKIIPSALDRVRSEMTRIRAERSLAESRRQNAAAYVNFLLNRELTTPIESDPVITPSLPAEMNWQDAFKGREEWKQLEMAQQINSLATEMEKSYRIPEVGLQIDIGSQNFDFKYGGYILAGLSVEVPVWSAGRNRLQVQQAELETKSTTAKSEQVKARINLQIQSDWNELRAQVDSWQSYSGQISQANRHYRDTSRRYREGVSNYIELLDAAKQVSDMELHQSLSLFNVLVKLADLERSTAAYPLP